KLSIPGTVRTTGVAPTQVNVGDNFNVTGEVSAHLDTDLVVAPEKVLYRTTNAQFSESYHSFPDTSPYLSVGAGLTPGPIELRYQIGTVLLAWVSLPGTSTGTRVECDTTGAEPK